MNDFIAIIFAPALTFFGIWLTNSNNRKVMIEQNKQQKSLIEMEHTNTMTKLEKEKKLEAEIQNKDRIMKIHVDRLEKIYYPIIEIYQKQDLEEEQTDRYLDGLDTVQYCEIEKIIMQDGNKILMGNDFLKKFYEAEKEHIFAQKHPESYDEYSQVLGVGFDSSGDFRELIESGIKESERLLDIY